MLCMSTSRFLAEQDREPTGWQFSGQQSRAHAHGVYFADIVERSPVRRNGRPIAAQHEPSVLRVDYEPSCLRPDEQPPEDTYAARRKWLDVQIHLADRADNPE